jgi:hypothetical protein
MTLSDVLIAATVIGVPSLHDHAVALTLQSSLTTDRLHRRVIGRLVASQQFDVDFHIP